MRLKSYLSMSTVIITTSIVVIVTASLFFFLRYEYYEGLKEKGTEIANILAHSPVVTQALVEKEQTGKIPPFIDKYIEKQRSWTEASFFVITDTQRIRLSHPDKEKIGQRFVGDDIERPLQTGKPVSTIGLGSLGWAIRNFVPVFHNNRMIGIVCVGYLTDKASGVLFNQYNRLLALIMSIYLIYITISCFVFWKFKKTFLDLEPEYIVNKFKEHKLVLNTIKEAIIGVDNEMNITTINNSAMKLLTKGKEMKSQYIDKPVMQLSTGLASLLLSSHGQMNNQNFQFSNETYDAEIYPIIRHNIIKGYVVIFYKQNPQVQLEYEVEHLTHHNEMLRSRAHEYANRLNALSGLLQLGEIEQAIEMIQEETDGYQQMLKNTLTLIEDPLICGVIVSKFTKAEHIHVRLSLDPDSHLDKYTPKAAEKLIIIIGNLLDNALLAAWENRKKVPAQVNIYLSDRSEHMIIEVEDSGKGISQGIEKYIYEYGVSSKQDIEEHGVGLFLVKRTVDAFDGNIEWEHTEEGNTLFSVYLDKKKMGKDE